MAPPARGLLEGDSSFNSASLRKPRVIAAILMGLAPMLVGYLVLHTMHGRALPLWLFMFFPPGFAALMAYSIPLLVYISHEEDFAETNPMNPRHYFSLWKRTMTALGSNDFKVKAKDL